jgi:hypothetical protein
MVNPTISGPVPFSASTNFLEVLPIDQAVDPVQHGEFSRSQIPRSDRALVGRPSSKPLAPRSLNTLPGAGTPDPTGESIIEMDQQLDTVASGSSPSSHRECAKHDTDDKGLLALAQELFDEILKCAQAIQEAEHTDFNKTLDAIALTSKKARDKSEDFRWKTFIQTGGSAAVTNPRRMALLLDKFKAQFESSPGTLANAMEMSIRLGAADCRPSLSDILEARFGTTSWFRQRILAAVDQPYSRAIRHRSTLGLGWYAPTWVAAGAGVGVAGHVLKERTHQGLFELLYFVAASAIVPLGAAVESLRFSKLLFTKARDLASLPDTTLRADLDSGGSLRKLIRTQTAEIANAGQGALEDNPVPEAMWSGFLARKLSLDVAPEVKRQWLQDAYPRLERLRPGTRGETIEVFLKQAAQFRLYGPDAMEFFEQRLGKLVDQLGADLSNPSCGAWKLPTYGKAIGALAPHLARLPPHRRIPLLDRILGDDFIGALSNNLKMYALGPLNALALQGFYAAPGDGGHGDVGVTSARYRIAERIRALASFTSNTRLGRFINEDFDNEDAVTEAIYSAFRFPMSTVNQLPRPSVTLDEWRGLVHMAQVAMREEVDLAPAANDLPDGVFPIGTVPTVPRALMVNSPTRRSSLPLFYEKASIASWRMAPEDRVEATCELLALMRTTCVDEADILRGSIDQFMDHEWLYQDNWQLVRRIFDAICDPLERRLTVFDARQVVNHLQGALEATIGEREAGDRVVFPPELLHHMADRLSTLVELRPHTVQSGRSVGQSGIMQQFTSMPDEPEARRHFNWKALPLKSFWQGHAETAKRAREEAEQAHQQARLQAAIDDATAAAIPQAPNGDEQV